MAGFHVNRHVSCSLGGIYEEKNVLLVTALSHLPDGQGFFQLQFSTLIARHIAYFNQAFLLQLICRAVHGVVFHSGNQNFIAFPGKSLNQEIQGVGVSRRENRVPGTVTVHHFADHLSGFQHNTGSGVGLSVSAAVDIAANIFYIIVYCISHNIRLRIRCGTIIQINHSVLLRITYQNTYYINRK